LVSDAFRRKRRNGWGTEVYSKSENALKKHGCARIEMDRSAAILVLRLEVHRDFSACAAQNRVIGVPGEFSYGGILSFLKLLRAAADNQNEMAGMATQVEVTPKQQSASAAERVMPELAGAMRYVARQPIMDLRGRVHGYELLFRAGREAAFRGDGDFATRQMLDNSVLFGLEKLTGGLPAFVNCTRESLVGEMVHVLPSGMTVLEILEDLEPTPELIAACRKLKSEGFRLALDDFTWKPELEPLVQMADYIKVDFIQTGFTERQSMIRQLGGAHVALVAEKIETQEEYNQACQEGFTLFQGYYFCRPALIESHKIPENSLSHIEIMQHLRGQTLDVRKLTTLLKRDPSLTYRLLRLVNSPMCAMRQEVRSIQAALLAVGEDTFRRVAMLAVASELNSGQPAEILRMAFVRGRFCELAAGIGELDSTEQYLLGLLSLLPAMLRLPMEQLAPSLPLRDEIREALLGKDTAERVLLHWLESHEYGDWEACDQVAHAHRLDQEFLVACYAEALLWAEAGISSAG
jgi:EAL and modified HD-GYP domain-containing signal transduction protein